MTSPPAPRPAFASSGDLAADRRFAWASAALSENSAEEAAELLEQVLELVPGWAPAWLALGDARIAQDRCEDAVLAWSRVLALDPSDILGAGPRLARLGALEPAGAMSPGYVAALFDDYAPRFEKHLTVALDYRGPELVMAALADVAPGARFARALDLGCGTGLMGVALRPVTDVIAGCDLSRVMVAQAAAKGVYDGLDVAGLEPWLASREAAGADLVTAADVLVYLGDLQPCFSAVARVLVPAGLFAFTVQTFDPGDPTDGYAVGPDLRYRHAATYLRRVAAEAGFEVALIRPAVVRRDRGADLPGFVGVARRG